MLADLDLLRHFTRMSQRNHGIDAGFYPLGSCSMKYNPRIAERVAALRGFAAAHPWAPASAVQGTLGALWELERSRMTSDLREVSLLHLLLLAHAHGGEVRKLARRHLDWLELHALPAADGDPVLGSLPPGAAGVHWNEDGFSLPPDCSSPFPSSR